MRMNYLLPIAGVAAVMMMPALLRADESVVKHPNQEATFKRIDRRAVLSDNRNFFNYGYGAGMLQGNVVHSVDTVIRQLDWYNEQVDLFLQNNTNIEIGRFSSVSAWGALYSNLPLLTGNEGAVDTSAPPYVLSLMFRGKLDEAATIARAILEKEPNNYAALLLLGIMSVRNEEDFPYLERAFIMNPYKTVWIFNWHLSHFIVELNPEWDFIHAYFSMLTEHRALLRGLQFYEPLEVRMSGAFHEKYRNPAHPFPGFEEVSREMEAMISAFRITMNQKRPGKVIPAETAQ